MDNSFNEIKTLIIDTNSSMRQIMVSMLRAMGIRTVIVANNEKQCFDLIATEGINLIVCGWTMPKLNALAILKQIRQTEKTQEIPFIIVSTIIEQAQIIQAVSHGVSEYLVPPFSKQIFEQRIQKAIQTPIRLTATKVTEKINAKRRQNKRSDKQLDVLIVDDIADNITILQELLKDEYRIKAALNAATALKICQSETPPDIILLDIMMPEVDGLTLCKQLKSNPLTQNITIIFVSALDQTSDVVKGLSLGAVDYITKPIVPEIVKARLKVHSQQLLNHKKTQNQVDYLIAQSAQQAEQTHLTQSKLHANLTDANVRCQAISRSYTKAKRVPEDISALQYHLMLSEHLLNESQLITQLEQDDLSVKRTRKGLANLVTTWLPSFQFALQEKRLTLFDYLSSEAYVTIDEQLLKVLFSSLYHFMIDTASSNTKLTIEANCFDKFTLLTFHHNGVCDDVFNPFSKVMIKGNNNESHNDYLIFQLAKALTAGLYYHSSEKFGTNFYLQLPN